MNDAWNAMALTEDEGASRCVVDAPSRHDRKILPADYAPHIDSKFAFGPVAHNCMFCASVTAARGSPDVEPAGAGLGGEDLQHRRGQVHGGGLVSPPGQQQGQEPGACPASSTVAGGPEAGGAARRSTPPTLGAPRVVRRRGVVTGRVVVPVPADLLRDAGSRHAWPACPLVGPVARRVSLSLPPWWCPIFARSCRSARRTGPWPRWPRTGRR